MKYLSFELTMPNRNSWNGKWSGDGNGYYIVKKFSDSKAGTESVNKILTNNSYYYNFGDGWGASIYVNEISGMEARKLKKKSMGFCGYDWMVSSIIQHGEIKTVKKSI